MKNLAAQDLTFSRVITLDGAFSLPNPNTIPYSLTFVSNIGTVPSGKKWKVEYWALNIDYIYGATGGDPLLYFFINNSAASPVSFPIWLEGGKTINIYYRTNSSGPRTMNYVVSILEFN
ncbi:MAG: hypothetical protein IPN88_16320 [Bacteroidetes bacterium]|nr:hypothetical protein [Bacteroidota bacterium]